MDDSQFVLLALDCSSKLGKAAGEAVVVVMLARQYVTHGSVEVDVVVDVVVMIMHDVDPRTTEYMPELQLMH